MRSLSACTALALLSALTICSCLPFANELLSAVQTAAGQTAPPPQSTNVPSPSPQSTSVPSLNPQSTNVPSPIPQGPSVQSPNIQSSWDGWQEGRAVHYGDEQANQQNPEYKGTTIHEGSCLYWYLDQNVGTGWDIAALSDHNYDFDGSCGNCYEVKCSNTGFTDGNGKYMDRMSACYDEDKSVVVRVTDACPCNYEANAESNYRWCCGDMYTMDLSYVAFAKLASRELGVIGIKYRRIECPPDTPPNTPEQDARHVAFDRSTY